MRILLTNDDGFDAPGIAALVRRLGQDHEVYVIAPDQERSGVGHAFTLGRPLTCETVAVGPGGHDVAAAHRCSGTPVDCVKLGILSLLGFRPDWVVSGVNKGANLTIDTLYSGTVAAALEGFIMGVPSLAVSLACEFTSEADPVLFDTAAAWAARVLAGEGWEEIEAGAACLNLNVPPLPADQIKGLRRATIAQSRYRDRYRVETGEDGRPRYWLEGTLDCQDPREWADVVAVRQGYVSLTPLACDLTAVELLEDMRFVS